MNRKGFTLVELLAVLVVLALIGGIAAVAYTSIVESSKTRIFKSYEKTMHSETMEFLAKHVEYIPANNATARFTLSQIGIDPINNPNNKNDLCLDSYVEVKRKNVGTVDSFTYKVCLICKNSNYNVNGTSCETYEN